MCTINVCNFMLSAVLSFLKNAIGERDGESGGQPNLHVVSLCDCFHHHLFIRVYSVL